MLTIKELLWATEKVINDYQPKQDTPMRRVLTTHDVPSSGKMSLICIMDEDEIGRGKLFWCRDARCSGRIHEYCSPKMEEIEFYPKVGRIGKFFGRLTQQEATKKAEEAITQLHVAEETLLRKMSEQFQSVKTFLEAKPNKTRED